MPSDELRERMEYLRRSYPVNDKREDCIWIEVADCDRLLAALDLADALQPLLDRHKECTESCCWLSEGVKGCRIAAEIKAALREKLERKEGKE